MESDPALPLQIHAGDMFAGKYRVERVLGRGGMSVVVAAWHPGLGQRVALKLLAMPAEIAPESVTRFSREARAAAALRSEYSARVVDVDVDEMGRHYIVMEHLEGLDLGDFYRKTDALPVTTCVGYVLHACEAIAEAHALGIIHRDLKPENLFLTHRVDGTPLIKVLDFGVSKLINPGIYSGEAADAGMSTANTVLGTPSYMSPDQIRTPGSIDGRSDIWSLGVILFELLTRRPPFPGDTVPDVLAAVLTKDPPALSELRASIPAELSAIVLRCLQKDVNQRWANVGLLAQALRPWSPVWALEAANRAARICGIDDSGSASTGEGARPGSSAHSAAPSQPRGPRVAVPAARRWVLIATGVGVGLLITGMLVTGFISAPRGNSSGPPRELPREAAAIAPIDVERSSATTDADPAAARGPSLFAALDAATPGMRREPPDTEASQLLSGSRAAPVSQGAGAPTRAVSQGAGAPTRAVSQGAGAPTRAVSQGAGAPTRAVSQGAGAPTRAVSQGAEASSAPRPAPASAQINAPTTPPPERRRKVIPAAIPVDPLSSRR